MPKNSLLSLDELDYIQQILGQSLPSDLLPTQSFRVDGGSVANGILVGLGQHTLLHLEAQFGDQCLSFPLHPPGKSEASRAQELTAVLTGGLPTFVVQGERDPFGTPVEVLAAVPLPSSRLYAVPGTHTIPQGSAAAVGAAVAAVLGGIPG